MSFEYDEDWLMRRLRETFALAFKLISPPSDTANIYEYALTKAAELDLTNSEMELAGDIFLRLEKYVTELFVNGECSEVAIQVSAIKVIDHVRDVLAKMLVIQP